MSTERSAANARRALEEHFGDLRDPRDPDKIEFPLLTILAIVLLAVMCGLQDWEEFEVWAAKRRAWLATFLDGLEARTPDESTLRRVFARLNPTAFRDAFMVWAQALKDAVPGRHIALDGKTLRAAFRRAAERTSLHLVSAFAADNALVLGQVRVAEGSNEIPALPKLLALLDLEGAVVTIDAAGTQTDVTDKIRKKGGDYVLPVKDNQKETYAEVSQYLLEAEGLGFVGLASRMTITRDAGHGRVEARRVVALPAPDELPSLDRWKDVKSVVLVERTRQVGDAPATRETAFYLTSLPYTRVKAIAGYIRGHWAIENNLHWSLDVQFREDANATRTGAAPEILGLLRRFAMNCFKLRTDVKTSLRKKAMHCLLDEDFLIATLLGGIG